MNTNAARKFLRRKDLPAITGLSIAFFKRAAWLGDGPPFVKLGRAVLYEESALLNWLDAHIRLGREGRHEGN